MDILHLIKWVKLRPTLFPPLKAYKVREEVPYFYTKWFLFFGNSVSESDVLKHLDYTVECDQHNPAIPVAIFLHSYAQCMDFLEGSGLIGQYVKEDAGLEEQEHLFLRSKLPPSWGSV